MKYTQDQSTFEYKYLHFADACIISHETFSSLFFFLSFEMKKDFFCQHRHSQDLYANEYTTERESFHHHRAWLKNI